MEPYEAMEVVVLVRDGGAVIRLGERVQYSPFVAVRAEIAGKGRGGGRPEGVELRDAYELLAVRGRGVEVHDEDLPERDMPTSDVSERRNQHCPAAQSEMTFGSELPSSS